MCAGEKLGRCEPVPLKERTREAAPPHESIGPQVGKWSSGSRLVRYEPTLTPRAVESCSRGLMRRTPSRRLCARAPHRKHYLLYEVSRTRQAVSVEESPGHLCSLSTSYKYLLRKHLRRFHPSQLSLTIRFCRCRQPPRTALTLVCRTRNGPPISIHAKTRETGTGKTELSEPVWPSRPSPAKSGPSSVCLDSQKGATLAAPLLSRSGSGADGTTGRAEGRSSSPGCGLSAVLAVRSPGDPGFSRTASRLLAVLAVPSLWDSVL